MLLLACGGGGLLALLPYVAAIGGFWISISPHDPDATLDFATLQGGQNNYFGTATESYEATLDKSVSSACGDARSAQQLTARFDGTAFTLSRSGTTAVCLTGVFVDEITIRLDTMPTPTLLRNQSVVDPNLGLGIWENADRTTQRLAFVSAPTGGDLKTQTGCEFQGDAKTGTVVASYRVSDPATGAQPQIESMVITRGDGTETWSNGTLVGVAGIKLESAGGIVQLQRRNANLPC
jgi:hypothetical protein